MDSLFGPDDLWKVAAFVLMVVAFYFLIDRVSKRTAGSTIRTPEEEHAYQEKFEPSGPPPRSRDFSIREISFRSFDACTGPPDARVFCDEMIVQFVDHLSGSTWTAEYVCATPEGMRRKLEETGWSTLFLDKLYVVTRFDLTMIAEAVMEDLTASNPEYSGEPPRAPGEEIDKGHAER